VSGIYGVSMSGGEIERPSLLILKILIHVTEIWRWKLNTRIYYYGLCAPFIYPFGTKNILSLYATMQQSLEFHSGESSRSISYLGNLEEFLRLPVLSELCFLK